jgi:hypothetical protein
LTPSLVVEQCLGKFRPQAASGWFHNYGLYSPDQIEQAAKAAARRAGRKLLSPMTRSPWEAIPGDRSLVWRLSGEPALVVKVCATDDPSTARMWKRLVEISARLQPSDGLAVPQVRLSGDQPVPWCVIDAAVGSPALLASTSAAEIFEVVLAVQRMSLEGFRFPATWRASTYIRQVEGPVRQLVAAEVIGEEAGRRALRLLEVHRPHLRELAPIIAHNDLALYHIYTGGHITWVIDWESAVRERLHMLDVAHLIVNHGPARPEWARELASIAMNHARKEFGDELRSNLIVSQLERAAGKALDLLRRRHQQSNQAVEALCGVLDERFLPD